MRGFNSVIFILFIFIFLPLNVFAENSCKVVAGSGKSLGSEIACGSEHFYVLDTEGEDVKMLAKYNLYAGVIIYKEKLENGQTCAELASEKGGFVKSDGFYVAPEGYCFYAKNIESDKVLQSEEAKSAHWDAELNYLYPQVGDIYMPFGFLMGGMVSNVPVQDGTTFYDFDVPQDIFSDDALNSISSSIVFSPSDIASPLQRYYKELKSMGVNLNNMSFLSLSELNNIVKEVSSKELPLKQWGENVEEVQGKTNPIMANFGDLKEYIPEKYKFLYSTTYWNSSVFVGGNSYAANGSSYYHIFTAQQGKLCGAGFDYCAPMTTIGCGLRPVIKVPKTNIDYLITTKTDGNGSIEVVKKSSGGSVIKFRANAKKGYKLDKIIIKTDSGEEISFSEGEIIQNPDGTISIDNLKFTMPFENITIESKWVSKQTNSLVSVKNAITNPKTGDKLTMTIILLIIFSILCLYFHKRKLKKFN